MDKREIISELEDLISNVINEEINGKNISNISLGRTTQYNGLTLMKLITIPTDEKVISKIKDIFKKNGFTMTYLPIANHPGYYISIKDEEIENIMYGKERAKLLNSIMKNSNCYKLIFKVIIFIVMIVVLTKLIPK